MPRPTEAARTGGMSEAVSHRFVHIQWQLFWAYLSEFPTCSTFLGTRKSSKVSEIWVVYTNDLQHIDKPGPKKLLCRGTCISYVSSDNGDLGCRRIQTQGLSPSCTTAVYKEKNSSCRIWIKAKRAAIDRLLYVLSQCWVVTCVPG